MTTTTTTAPFDYTHCRVCGTEVKPALRALAERRIENAHCLSPACYRTEILARFGCCEKAELMECVCAYAFSCPVHGTKHIGTHD